jgi:hypothetical protein
MSRKLQLHRWVVQVTRRHAKTRARNAALEADFEKFLREFEAFRQMRIPKTIQ